MKKYCALLSLALLMAACASAPDRFYALRPRPDALAQRAAAPAVEVALMVSLPPLVDRPQLVVQSPGGVTIQEHERWAAPLADQFQSVLGQDLERRRTDVFITTRSAGQNALHIDVDVISVIARVGTDVTLDVRWRMRPPSAAPIHGRESFSCSATRGLTGMADAVSDCVAKLADRLAAALPDP